jgi:hypothetical protein
MGTVASDQLRWTADQLVHHCGYPSAVLAGILPNAAHLKSGGFHVSIDDLYAHGNGDDYSNTRPNDRGFNRQYAAAIDLALGRSDMIRAYGSIHAAWADRSDPRRRFFNAINAWDGSGDATRFDFDANTAKYASPDHRQHTHSEFHRRYVLDDQAARALVSIYSGETKAAWLARENPPREVTYMKFEITMPALKQGDNDNDFPNAYRRIARIQRIVGATADGDWGVKTTEAIASWCKVPTAQAKTMTENLWREILGLS